jgi:[acyl-carrier-protein] S-malonyltransferase
MGRDLARDFDVAKQTFAEADDALGFAISKLCWEGPEAELTLTENTQPAILANSIAVWRALGSPTAAFACGHSLGEWTALVAAGALDFADALRLVRLRGRYMQEAVPAGTGAMAALMGLAPDVVAEVCAAAGGVVSPANFNGAGQIVIAGEAAAVERAIEIAKEKGAKRAVPLAVSAPFHCALMKPAADKLAADLAEVAVKDPRFPVVHNVDAQPNSARSAVKSILLEQITSPVKWEACVQRLAQEGVDEGLELGSGSVLSGLVKRIAPTIKMRSIGEPHEVKGS